MKSLCDQLRFKSGRLFRRFSQDDIGGLSQLPGTHLRGDSFSFAFCRFPDFFDHAAGGSRICDSVDQYEFPERAVPGKRIQNDRRRQFQSAAGDLVFLHEDGVAVLTGIDIHCIEDLRHLAGNQPCADFCQEIAAGRQDPAVQP